SMKQSMKNFDLPNYSMRISISREKFDLEEEPTNLTLILTRHKKRISYALEEIRFDFTEVTVTPFGKSPFTVYEVEIEVVAQDKLRAIPLLLKYAFDIFRELIGTSNVSLPIKLLVSNSEKSYIIEKTNLICGSKRLLSTERKTQQRREETIDYSIITNARTVKARDLTAGNLVPKDPNNTNSVIYTMTIKADGVLKLLLIDETGIYFIGTPDNVIKIRDETFPDYIGSVFIGELVWDTIAERPLFLFFDALVIRQDTRVQQKNFNERWAYINLFIQESQIQEVFRKLFIIQNYTGSKGETLQREVYIEFRLKEFYLFKTAKEFYNYANNLLSTPWSFSTDGLILTPYNFPYHTTLDLNNVSSRRLATDPDILKVKSSEDLTIDFEVRHEIGEGSTIALYCSNGNRPQVKFSGDQQNPFNPAKNLEISDELLAIETFSLGELAEHSLHSCLGCR
ncbi:MAG: 7-methylguanosine mRNA capping enzyme, partial [Solivirus sp.]